MPGTYWTQQMFLESPWQMNARVTTKCWYQVLSAGEFLLWGSERCHPMYRHYWQQGSWWTGGGRLWVFSLAGGFWVSQEDFGKWRTEACEVHSIVIRTQRKAAIYYVYYNIKPPLHCLQALGILACKSLPSSCWWMFRGAEKLKRRRTGGAEFGELGRDLDFPKLGGAGYTTRQRGRSSWPNEWNSTKRSRRVCSSLNSSRKEQEEEKEPSNQMELHPGLRPTMGSHAWKQTFWPHDLHPLLPPSTFYFLKE